MKTNLVSIFAAAVGLFVATVQPAFGIIVQTVTVGYTETPSLLNVAGCAPTITDKLGGGIFSFTDTFTLNVADTDSLFMASPPDPCSGGNPVIDVMETLGVYFTATLGTHTASGAGTGLYTARYTGSVLPCASLHPGSGDGGKSDCINWAGPQIQLNLGMYTLDITLNDAVDWNITPTVTFLLVDSQHAPEPGTLALLGLGLAGLAASRRRKQ